MLIPRTYSEQFSQVIVIIVNINIYISNKFSFQLQTEIYFFCEKIVLISCLLVKPVVCKKSQKFVL